MLTWMIAGVATWDVDIEVLRPMNIRLAYVIFAGVQNGHNIVRGLDGHCCNLRYITALVTVMTMTYRD